MISFHLEPAWTSPDGEPILETVANRIVPNCRTIYLANAEKQPDFAFCCVALFYSDRPTKGESPAGGLDYSSLVICNLVTNIDRGIRAIATEMLSQVDWDAQAENDILW